VDAGEVLEELSRHAVVFRDVYYAERPQVGKWMVMARHLMVALVVSRECERAWCVDVPSVWNCKRAGNDDGSAEDAEVWC